MGKPLELDLTSIELRTTKPDESIHQFLESNDLPTEDIDSPDVTLYELTLDNERIGIGGYEIHDSTALLRSIAVKSSLRGRGIGTTICLQLEDKIACSMCDEIYLFTNDAAGFFERIGYERINRKTAPEAVQLTQEFAELCPSTAIFMKKTV